MKVTEAHFIGAKHFRSSVCVCVCVCVCVTGAKHFRSSVCVCVCVSFFKVLLFIYLASLGLSSSTQDLQSSFWHARSSAAACEI